MLDEKKKKEGEYSIGGSKPQERDQGVNINSKDDIKPSCYSSFPQLKHTSTLWVVGVDKRRIGSVHQRVVF